jgi:hypothetical protein
MPKAPIVVPPLSPIVQSVFESFLKELEDAKVLDAGARARLKKSLINDRETGAQPLRDAMFGTDAQAQ